MRPARDMTDGEIEGAIASLGLLQRALKLERARRRRLEAAATNGRTAMTKRQYSLYRKLFTGGLSRDEARAEALKGDAA